MLRKLISPSPGTEHREGQLYKDIEHAGQRFSIYYGYYEEADRRSKYSEPIPIYPDFREEPVYNDTGQPFATAMQDACPHYSGRLRRDKDCGSCGHFAPGEDLIGLCNCPHNRRNE